MNNEFSLIYIFYKQPRRKLGCINIKTNIKKMVVGK
jgi:hypothetical protein